MSKYNVVSKQNLKIFSYENNLQYLQGHWCLHGGPFCVERAHTVEEVWTVGFYKDCLFNLFANHFWCQNWIQKVGFYPSIFKETETIELKLSKRFTKRKSAFILTFEIVKQDNNGL